MAQGVVFKQWYKSANLSGIAARNQKHLNYIATRKGSIQNPGCGFGLWGRLPDQPLGNIDNLEWAKKAVGTASSKHTLYRAIISVDKETAQQYDLYNRSTWESLVNERIKIIAKEMDIEARHFCWTASMHHTKSHPHVHIIYWDNSGKVRNEHIPQERFEIMAEKVRAAFNLGIFHEELPELQAAQKEALSSVKLELMAMCRELNLTEALDLNRVTKTKLDELTQDFANLVLAIPKKGSLRYHSLPEPFKDQVNSFIGKIMKISDFAVMERKYLKLTNEISELYGNGESTKLQNHEAAKRKLYTDLGNGILSLMRNYLDEQKAISPTEKTALRAMIRGNTEALLLRNEDYHALLALLPVCRTPLHVLQEDKQFANLHKKLAVEICNDIRIRTKVQGYANALIQQLSTTRLAEKGDTVEFLNRSGTATVDSISVNGSLKLRINQQNGKSYESTARQEEVRVFPETSDGVTFINLREKTERDAYHVVCEVLDERIFADSSYLAQMQGQTVLNMLIRLFSDFSQGANQQKSQRDLKKSRSKDMSKTARRDRKKQQEYGGGWDFEM